MQRFTQFSLHSTSLTNSKTCKSWRSALKTNRPKSQSHWAKLKSKKKAWCSLMNSYKILSAITWSISLSFKRKLNRFLLGSTTYTIITTSSSTTLTTKCHLLKVEQRQTKPDFWTSRMKWEIWVKESLKIPQSSSKTSNRWNQTFTKKELMTALGLFSWRLTQQCWRKSRTWLSLSIGFATK